MTRINRMLLLFTALLMISSVAFANYTYHRTDVLSAGDQVHANFWEDSNDATLWVGDLVNYADMVTITLDSGSQYFGLNKSIEGYGVFHLGISEADGGFIPGTEMNDICIGYGYELESVNIGVLLNRQSSAFDPGGTDGGDIKETWHSFTFGADYVWNDETNIDVAFMYTKGSSEDLDDISENDLDATGMAFGVRAFYPMEEGLTLIPVFLFMTETDFDVNTDYDEYKETSIALGLGFNWAINDGNDLMLGLSWQSMKETTDYTEASTYEDIEETYTNFPGLGMAIEHEFFDWLTARVGTSKSWEKSADDTEGDPYHMDYPWVFELGAGIALGDWQIDLGLNTDWLYNLGYWVHGNAANQAPISGIQAKLYF